MKEFVFEIASELVGVVVFSVIGSVLGVGGFVLERLGYAVLLSGDSTMGVWYLYMGSIALFVAVYLIGIREVLPRVTAIYSK